MNAVEGFFSRLSRRRLRHAIFNALDARIAATGGYIAHHNASDARLFRWCQKPEVLVVACRKGHRNLPGLVA